MRKTLSWVSLVLEKILLLISSLQDLTYTALLDFEAPTSIINIGDGITDYSLNNFGAPWTLFNVTGLDNLQGVINHTDYYYGEETSIEYQVNVLDMQNTTIFTSGFIPLSGTQSSLIDLGVPTIYSRLALRTMEKEKISDRMCKNIEIPH